MTDPRLTLDSSKGRADWSDYRIFWAVVRYGGFSAAARALGMNQAGLSRRVRDLEIRLNVKLLDRNHNGVLLTEAGEMVFDHIVTMENSAASIEKLVMDRDRRAEGRVVISAPDGVGGLLLAPALPGFLASNPAIRLVIDCGLWQEAPVKGQPEIFLKFQPPMDPDLVAEPIAHVHWCVFAAQSYIDIYGKPTSLAQAADHRAVDLTAYGKLTPEAFSEKSKGFMNIRTVHVETNSSTVLFTSVAHGAGIAPLPTYVLTIDPSLVVLDDSAFVSMPLWMCHSRELAHSARIKRVQQWLREIFDSRQKPWFRKEFVHPSEFIELAKVHADASRAPDKATAPVDPKLLSGFRSSGV